MKKSQFNNNIKIITGVITFTFWLSPVLQQLIFNDFLKRTYDFGGLTHVPIFIFQGLHIISRFLAYFTQIFFFALCWLITYKLIVAIIHIRR